MSAPKLVHMVEVVRRYDEMMKLAQVTLVIGQVVHAIVMHCGLTPHTPEGFGG